MTEITRIGVDTSKAVFTLHGVDEKDRPVLRLNLRRGQLLGFFRKQQPAIVALEACGSSYHWVQFELLESARTSIQAWLEHRDGTIEDYAFPRPCKASQHSTVREAGR